MKISFFIDKRQVGKTKKALEIFLEDPGNTIFCVCIPKEIKRLKNRLIAEYFIDNNSKIFKNLIIPSFFNEKTMRNSKIKISSIDTLIFDEYLFLHPKEIKRINESLIYFNKIKNIYCFSTPSQIYHKEDFEFVTNFKKTSHFISFNEAINNYNYYLKRKLLLEIKKYHFRDRNRKETLIRLYESFLTDKNTIIYHNVLHNPNLNPLSRKYYCNPFDYEKQVNGQFLI